jgi:DNA-binding NarL/FixJ family response regulator
MAGVTAQSQQQTIRVAVADDHTVLRRIVELACEDRAGLEMVAEAADGLEAIDVVTEHDPDVLVLDLALPNMDGFEVARRLKEQGVRTRILVLTARDDFEAVFQSMRGGVDGFLDKSADIDEVADAIESIALGGRVFTEAQERGALDELGRHLKRTRESSRVTSSLTDREIQVVRLIREGMTTRQMATRLQVSQRTIESHIEKLYRKLGVSSRVQAVSKAAELGVLEQTEPGAPE